MRGNPIKISAPTLQELESVHSAIRRVIKADTSRRRQQGAPQHDLAGTGSMDNTETFGSNAAQHATVRRSSLAGPAGTAQGRRVIKPTQSRRFERGRQLVARSIEGEQIDRLRNAICA